MIHSSPPWGSDLEKRDKTTNQDQQNAEDADQYANIWGFDDPKKKKKK